MMLLLARLFVNLIVSRLKSTKTSGKLTTYNARKYSKALMIKDKTRTSRMETVTATNITRS